jgi:hypothetical protein
MEEIPDIRICQRLSRPQVYSAPGWIKSMTQLVIEPATFRLVAQRPNNLRHGFPVLMTGIK